MDPDRPTPEEELGGLLAELPPAPAAWVQAAAERPALRRDVERIAALTEADRAFRAAVVADLESALAQAGFEPTPELIAALRDEHHSSSGKIPSPAPSRGHPTNAAERGPREGAGDDEPAEPQA